MFEASLDIRAWKSQPRGRSPKVLEQALIGACPGLHRRNPHRGVTLGIIYILPPGGEEDELKREQFSAFSVLGDKDRCRGIIMGTVSVVVLCFIHEV